MTSSSESKEPRVRAGTTRPHEHWTVAREAALEASLAKMLEERAQAVNRLGRVRRALRRSVAARKRAQASLRAADRQREVLLALLAHELRNPLAALLSAAEILRIASLEGTAAAQARAIIERQVKQLSRVIADWVDVSSLEPGRVPLNDEHVDLSEILQLTPEGDAMQVERLASSEPSSCLARSDLHRGACVSPARILIADDNFDAAQGLALLLAMDGHEVRTATDGLQALGIAEEFRPQLALLDIGMPKLDGYETARRLRERPWACGTRLFALTGWGPEEVRERTREAGFERVLVKPVEPACLAELLNACP